MPRGKKRIDVLINFVLKNYKQIADRLDEIIFKLREIGVITDKTTKRVTQANGKIIRSYKGVKKAIDELDEAEKKRKKTIDESNKSTSKFGKTLKDFGKKTLTAAAFVLRFATVFAVIGVVRTFTIGAVQAFVEFQGAMKDLEAISGKSAKEVEGLGKEIVDAAGKTKFLAGEIAEASKELLRLGLTAQEVERSIGVVAQLAQATGESLSQTAQLVGKTLNAFDLEAGSATELAVSFTAAINESALSVEALGTAMQYVSSLAAGLGVDFRETTGALGVLANAGFKASRAGTGLRQIFLELGAEGGSLLPILDDLAEQHISLSQAEDLVGKRAAAQLLTLVNNREEMRNLITVQSEYTRLLTATAAQGGAFAGQIGALRSAFDALLVRMGSAIERSEILINLLRLMDDDAADVILAYKVLNQNLGYNSEEMDKAVKGYRRVTELGIKPWVEETREVLKMHDGMREKVTQTYRVVSQAWKEAIPGFENLTNAQQDALIALFESEARLIEIEEKATSGIEERVQKEYDLAETMKLSRDEAYEALSKEIKLREEALKKDNNYLDGLERESELWYEQWELVRFNTEELELLRRKRAEVQGTFEEPLAEASEEDLATFKALFTLQNNIIKAGKEGDVSALKTLTEEWEKQKQLLIDEGLMDEYLAYVDALLQPASNERNRAAEAVAEFNAAIEQFGSLRDVVGGQSFDAEGNVITTFTGVDVDAAYKDLLKQIEDNADLTVEEQSKLTIALTEQYEKYLEERKKLTEKSNEEESQIRKRNLDQAIDSFTQVANTANEAMLDAATRRIELERLAAEERYDYEEQRLKDMSERNLITQQQYERELAKIKEKRIRKENELAEARFDAEKRNSLAGIAIDTASAIAKTFAQLGYPLGLIPAAILAAQGLAQAAIISSQKFTPVKYEDGGLLTGPSHAQGGIPISVNGTYGAEAEGGEFIVNKRATRVFEPLLTMINSFGRKSAVPTPGFFEDGGIIDPSSYSPQIAGIQNRHSTIQEVFISEEKLMRKGKEKYDNDLRSTI
jgi:hypothetical protein